ncbi:MAG: hypothetical protein BWX70_01548 [Verrucomicrobia bacterium ADurb.Bin070]|nr:MAG: hypothetical protein BWX70_01548 [Verrucomicrobia bacterium ADurb.Bin070]
MCTVLLLKTDAATEQALIQSVSRTATLLALCVASANVLQWLRLNSGTYKFMKKEF